MKRKFLLSLCAVLVLGLAAGCEDLPQVSTSEDSQVSSGELEYGDGSTLNMAVQYQANTGMVLDAEFAPYNAADGVEYQAGDFKPVWKELQSRLKFTINDVTPRESNLTRMFEKLQLDNFEGVHIANGPVSYINREALTRNRFVALNEHWDRLPNFKKFLDENEIVKINITAGDGNIYFAPYFDGYNDLERMFIARVDWVEKLLDGDEIAYDTETLLGETYYTPYMPETLDTKISVPNAEGSAVQEITKKYTKNVITKQNELEVKNGKNVCEVLVDHIDETYGEQYNKRSDLFVGVDAAYDADELVALFRCVKTNPKLLTGSDEKPVVPFFPRAKSHDRSSDILRLMAIWGVRGFESRSDYLFIDENGVLQDARVQEDTMDGLERLNQLYKEKLILQDFNDNSATSGGSGKYREDLCKDNLGFMTYDYNQTTTILNKAHEEEHEGFNLAPVMPAIANWLNDGKYFHFTESIRSVKTEGWGITTNATGNVLYKALQLFDYFWSEEGNRLMSYGPEAWIDGTIEYMGRTVPKLSAKALEELATLAAGNYTNYYRRFLGGTLPIGYIKEQGMEYQTVHPKGQVGLDKLMKAMELGTFKTVLVNPTESDNPFFKMVPTTFPLTKAEETTNEEIIIPTLGEKFKPRSSGGYIEFLKYITNGFGATGEEETLTKEGLIDQIVNEWNQKIYIAIYRDSYERLYK